MQSTRLANWDELNGLAEHLGVFEKWAEVCDDFKIQMAGYLDVTTQRNLSLCAKAEHAIVEKASVPVNRVEIRETPGAVTVVVQFPRELRRRAKEFRKDSTSSSEDGVKFVEKWLRKSRFEVNEMCVEMENYPMASSIIKSLPNCKKFRILYRNPEQFVWWLHLLPARLDELDVVMRDTTVIPSEMFDLPQVRDTSGKVSFWCDVGITDEQLLKLNARCIVVTAIAVTDRGINAFIRRWARGAGVDGFQAVYLYLRRRCDREAVLDGVTYELLSPSFYHDTAHYAVAGEVPELAAKTLTVSFSSDGVQLFPTHPATRSESESESE